MTLTYETVSVGDEVYCLAWVGNRFTVVGKDDEQRLVALEGEAASDPYGAHVDLFDETMWMLTDQPWDQIWYWPDRAGEHYLDVYLRWVGRQEPGRVIVGYLATRAASPTSGASSFEPEAFDRLRIHSIDDSFAQTLVEPVALAADPGRRPDVDDLNAREHEWAAVGPRAPIRISMISYRWAVSYGDVILSGKTSPHPWVTSVLVRINGCHAPAPSVAGGGSPPRRRCRRPSQARDRLPADAHPWCRRRSSSAPRQ